MDNLPKTFRLAKLTIEYKQKTKLFPQTLDNVKNHSVGYVPGFLYITLQSGKQFYINLEIINGYSVEYYD